MRTFCLSLLGIGLFAMGATAQSVTKTAGGILARVNENVITYHQVQDATRDSVAPLINRYANEPKEFYRKIEELQKERLELLIENRLIIDDFRKGGISVPERYVEDQIRKDIRDRFGDRVALTRALKQTGQTFESYRDKTRERIILDIMHYRHLSNEKLVISPKRIEDFYATNKTVFAVDPSVRFRMITLTKIAGDDLASKRKLIAEIADKISKGADFAEMAKTYSEDAYAKDGGDHKEMLEVATMREEFRTHAANLPIHKASPVIETGDGFYLLVVEERKEAHTKALAEVRDEIEQTLVLQERNRLERRWIDRLRKKGFVSYF